MMVDKIINLLDELPKYWNKSENSNIYKFLHSFATALQDYDDEKVAAELEIFLETSSGTYLDGIAELFRLRRKSNESDASLRTRIKSWFLGTGGGGTVNSILNTIILSTGISKSDISINEDIMKVSANASIGFDGDTATVLANLAQDVKAAGVFAIFNITSEFDDSVTVVDTPSITASNVFIIEQADSLIESEKVIS